MKVVFGMMLALLMLISYARAQCDGQNPKITVAGPTVHNDIFGAFVQYEENIQLFCSHHETEALTLRRNEEDLPANRINKTTIVSSLKPMLGLYKYICVSKTGCEDSLFIHHQPAIQVASPRLRLKNLSSSEYFVPYGDEYQIICAGREHETLEISTGWPKIELHTDAVNATSIAYFARADHTGEIDYACRAKYINEASSVDITVDFFPEAYNFSCILLDDEKIECSWSLASTQNTFKLFYKDELLLCSGTAGSRSCAWNNIFMRRRLACHDHKNDFLLLRTCNSYVCNNQTFPFKFYPIMINDPVVFKLLDCSSHGALMAWRDCCVLDKPCNYKVEYRLLAYGDTWIHADASSVRCEHDGYCEFRLPLPYPDSEYEARVYNKHAATSDERFWSDPASVPLVTKPTDDCRCKPGNKETISCAASCEAAELSEHIMNRSKALRNFRKILKLKRERFHKKLNYLKEMKYLEDGYNKLAAEFDST